MSKHAVSTTNPCKMCRPIGACLAFKGVENSMVLLHGSQGCSTYMRRYISGHFNEPVDIASSSMSEKAAVYGGGSQLKQGIKNVIAKYEPTVLGVATTCLTETIGDNVPMILSELLAEHPELEKVKIIPVSTPSYAGSHMDGFYDSLVAVLDHLAEGGPQTKAVNIFPGFVSPEDLRHLREIMDDLGLPAIVFADYSETLDGGIEEEFERIPPGGTTIGEIVLSGSSRHSIEFNVASPEGQSCAGFLEKRFGISGERLPMPIGIRNCDRFFNSLSAIAGQPLPRKYEQERSRLLDAMVDAHKYLFGKRALVYGDSEMVIAMASFLADIGVLPVICASGGGNGRYVEEIEKITAGPTTEAPLILKETDFDEIERQAVELGVDLLVGNSKGLRIARKVNAPLLRIGFPVHDRLAAQRILHLGYRGTVNLLDALTNIVIAKEQVELGYDYSYM